MFDYINPKSLHLYIADFWGEQTWVEQTSSRTEQLS